MVPDCTKELVLYIATTIYDVIPKEDSIKALVGYDDENYFFSDRNDDTRKYVLKVANSCNSSQDLVDIIDEVLDNSLAYLERTPFLEFTIPKLIRTSSNKLSTNAKLRSPISERTMLCNVRLFEFFEGITISTLMSNRVDVALYLKLGRICNQVFRYLRTQRHLIDKLRAVRGDSFDWQVVGSDRRIAELVDEIYPSKSGTRYQLVAEVLEEFRNIRDDFNRLPHYIIHSDLNESNILIDERLLNNNSSLDQAEFCVLDFGDLQTGPEIVELAVLILYNVLKQDKIDFSEALCTVAKWTYQGYLTNSERAFIPEEALMIPTIMRLRLCQSLLKGLQAYRADPANEYTFTTNIRGWDLLELLVSNGTFNDNKRVIEMWTL